MAGAEMSSQHSTEEATRAHVSVDHGEMTELTTLGTAHLQLAVSNH